MTEAEARIEALKREWTGRYVRVEAGHPQWQRFAGVVGRVVTVNCNGNAVVDFQDGAWYDIPAKAEFLARIDAPAAGRFDAGVNSAQPFPARKG